MSPTIIFDKSSLQSLRPEEFQEANRYFYMVIPPILLQEILGDLSLEPDACRDPAVIVAALARKVPTTNSAVLPDFRLLCIQNLLGHTVPMDHRGPVADEADVVFAEDGSYAIIHPEKSAVLRWCQRQFTEADQHSAAALRQRGHGTDFEAAKQALSRLEFTAETLQESLSFIDETLANSETQSSLIQWFLPVLGYDQPTNSKVFARWEQAVSMPLGEFAPYATHCLRVHLLFYQGMLLNLVSTRSSNVIDIEYLCYLPFANAFSSGDKLHKQFTPLIHEDDQSFVERDQLRRSLSEIATARETNKDAVPGEDSVITELWQKHCNRGPP